MTTQAEVDHVIGQEALIKSGNWEKIDVRLIHNLLDPEKSFSYSGDTAGLVLKAVKNNALLEKVYFLLLVNHATGENWPQSAIQGFEFLSRVGDIIAASGSIDTIIALANDDTVSYVEASSPVSPDCD